MMIENGVNLTPLGEEKAGKEVVEQDAFLTSASINFILCKLIIAKLKTR